MGLGESAANVYFKLPLLNWEVCSPTRRSTLTREEIRRSVVFLERILIQSVWLYRCLRRELSPTMNTELGY